MDPYRFEKKGVANFLTKFWPDFLIFMVAGMMILQTNFWLGLVTWIVFKVGQYKFS